MYANESIHHDMHDPGFFPTEYIFPNCAPNKMLSHYNHILIGCFRDIFQSVSAPTATDNALQEFKQLALRKEHTHPYML